VISGHSTAALDFDSNVGALARRVLARFPFGVLVTDRQGDVLAVNAMLEELCGDVAAGADETLRPCCRLFGCREPGGPLHGGCLTDLALAAGGPLPEVRASGLAGPVWVVGTPLDGGQVLFHVRPTRAEERRRHARTLRQGPHLHLELLGSARLDGAAPERWLKQRPGVLLKYLACERGRIIPAEEIVEALWPGAGVDALSNLRYVVHALRKRVEPQRAARDPSAFILADRGGYGLDLRHVTIDADLFEAAALEGLEEADAGNPAQARPRLERALELYRGDLLADEPFAEFAFAERERLRDLAVRAARGCAQVLLRLRDVEAAARVVRLLAEMEPLDTDVQRADIALCLRRGRRTEATRRYGLLRARMWRELGESPDFALSDVAGQRELSISV
jgi:DNA-binding SARP family transcriptional activator